jgi:hypothetical protein
MLKISLTIRIAQKCARWETKMFVFNLLFRDGVGGDNIRPF